MPGHSCHEVLLFHVPAQFTVSLHMKTSYFFFANIGQGCTIFGCSNLQLSALGFPIADTFIRMQASLGALYQDPAWVKHLMTQSYACPHGSGVVYFFQSSYISQNGTGCVAGTNNPNVSVT